MVQVQRNFYTPQYHGFLPCCGQEVNYHVKDKYPNQTERMTCQKCAREFNLRFFPNDNGVMTLEIREVRLK